MANDPTLAQRIRAKFPGQYDDLSDTELETRVLSKHPEYGDLPRTKTPEHASDETTTPEAPRHPSAVGGSLREPALAAIPLYGPARMAGLDLPTAGGIAGGIATGGAGLIPMALAATAGGGAGSIAKNAIDYFTG